MCIVSNHKFVVICYSSNSKPIHSVISIWYNQECLEQEINITSGSRAVSAGGFRLTYAFVVKGRRNFLKAPVPLREQ